MYYEERIQSIGTILRKPQDTITRDDIHDLRVEIKKLHAVAQLVQYCANDFRKKKFLKPYNKIFKEAGHVRELQIEVSMFKKLNVTDDMKGYRKHLKKQVKKAKRRFLACLNANRLNKLEATHKWIVAYIDTVEENEVREFLQTKNREMDGLTAHGNLKKKEAHELRKLLKTFYYVVLMFEAKNDRFKSIDSFQELLGQWHDGIVTKGYLQKAAGSGSPHPKEAKHTTAVKHKVAAESKTLFNAINSRLPDLQRGKQQLLQGLLQ